MKAPHTVYMYGGSIEAKPSVGGCPGDWGILATHLTRKLPKSCNPWLRLFIISRKNVENNNVKRDYPNLDRCHGREPLATISATPGPLAQFNTVHWIASHFIVTSSKGDMKMLLPRTSARQKHIPVANRVSLARVARKGVADCPGTRFSWINIAPSNCQQDSHSNRDTGLN